jgi:hypothetical protein
MEEKFRMRLDSAVISIDPSKLTNKTMSFMNM